MFAIIKDFGKLYVPDPLYGDFKLNVFPFVHHEGHYVKLPDGFGRWDDALNHILSHVPVVNGARQHYVTIDSKFFTVAETQRREGVHIDGNFCVDPTFAPKRTWGGGNDGGTWNGARYNQELGIAESTWASPYNVAIPIGEYVSDSKGGIFCASSEIGCRAWSGEFYGEVGDGGNCESMKEQFTKDREILFDVDNLYFMTSNTPHESIMINKGVRRTFMRVTLNHNYPNEFILNNKLSQNYARIY